MRYTRITVNPAQMEGIPCIRGLSIPVATIVGMVAENMSQLRSDVTQFLLHLKSRNILYYCRL